MWIKNNCCLDTSLLVKKCPCKPIGEGLKCAMTSISQFHPLVQFSSQSLIKSLLNHVILIILARVQTLIRRWNLRFLCVLFYFLITLFSCAVTIWRVVSESTLRDPTFTKIHMNNLRA